MSHGDDESEFEKEEYYDERWNMRMNGKIVMKKMVKLLNLIATRISE